MIHQIEVETQRLILKSITPAYIHKLFKEKNNK